MNIRKLNNTDQPALEKYVGQYVESSLFILSNCLVAGLEFHNEPYQGEYYAAFSEQGGLQGVLVHYWNGNIMMQAPDIDVLLELADAFKQQVNRPVAGILGATAQAEVLIESLGLGEADYMMNTDDGLYSLVLDALYQPVDSQEGNCVPVNKSYESLLHKWLSSYNIEALGAVDNEALVKRVTQTVNRMVKHGDSWVLTINGQPVSLCGFNARLPEIVQIGPVWTPPEYRNQGYARLLVARTLEVARKEGVQRAILFTDNPPAARAYEAIGFRRIGYYRLALLRNEISIA